MTSLLQRPRNRVSSDEWIAGVAISFAGALSLVLAAAVFHQQFRHWFIIPLVLCASIVGSDAIQWLRGRLDLFDPVGLVGIFGLHFFFLAPMAHVWWDHWMYFHIVPPGDWRPWVGGMAVLNFFGLVLYVLARGPLDGSSQHLPRSNWKVNKQRLTILLVLGMATSGALQLWFYLKLGGLRSYVEATERGGSAFEGAGILFAVSESFPILMAILLVVLVSDGTRKSFLTVLAILGTYVILRILFGGLRGSRINTIWGLFWAVGLIHFWIRPFSRKLVFAGAGCLFAFLYFYGFYKSFGADLAVQALVDSDIRSRLSYQSRRSVLGTALDDLARSDVQAFLLHRLHIPGSDYHHPWGRTYWGAAALVIPKRIWPDRPLGKTYEGTIAQFGQGIYPPSRLSTRQYGLAGEALLNFGPVAVPLSFLILALTVRMSRRLIIVIDHVDGRMLLAPFLTSLSIIILVWDSDNLLFGTVKHFLLPAVIVALGCTRVPLLSARRVSS
jgi:hypothetical protein